MERRSFFRKLALGAIAAPVAVMAKEGPVRRAVCKRVELPADMGKVNHMTMLGDRIFFATEKDVWAMHKDVWAMHKDELK